MMNSKRGLLLGAGVVISLLTGCGAKATTTQSPSNAVSTPPAGSAPSPAGDIPDTQTFVAYTSPQGYQLQVPEGWARSTNQNEASFVNQYDGVKVSISSVSTAPTLNSIQHNEVAELKASGQNVKVLSVNKVNLASGEAFLITYESDSTANSVTGKQITLEDNQYVYFKNGKEAKLTLWAPLGADNKDQWNKMANSFTWK